MGNLKKTFEKEIVKDLQNKLGLKNPMAVPRVLKIVINMSSKDFLSDKKNLEQAKEELSFVSGQKPKVTRAKESVAAFKLRSGDPIGLTVTLRGKKMFDFFEKLVKVVLPRTRDFSGIEVRSLDGRGNLTIGFSEHTTFPEIEPGKVEKLRGLEVTVVTGAKDSEMAKVLLEAMGMPFKKS